ncbi:MAG: hypothetical protein ACYSU0_12640, partial [Planctomycetota bacterium]
QPPEDNYPDGIIFLAHWTAMSLLTWGALSVVFGIPVTAAFSVVARFPLSAVFSAFITLLVMVAAFVTTTKLLKIEKKRIALVWLATIVVSPAIHYALFLCLGMMIGFPAQD